MPGGKDKTGWSPSLKMFPLSPLSPQEDPGRVTADLPLHLQQCL